jgi:ABC-type branched-subunit amino acid transport system substrate-binding protein
MFNGVRLAVDDHNAANPARPVRLVFRDTEGTSEGARAAVQRALEAGADIILGPLFSAEAAAAAEVAEQSSAVLIAPLATDEVVAAGRRFVFQANPTFPVRGRQMARYAVERAGARNLAVVAEAGTFGAVMADAFEAEATRLGATIVSTSRMRDAAGWNVLPELVGRERLRTAQAVYLPVTGGDAPEHAASALRGLEEMSLDIQALGNTEWEGLDASRSRAGRFRAVFDQDFHVDDASAGEFAARYRALAGVRADRLALMGYDAARMVLDVAWPEGGVQASGAALADRLRAAPLHNGLGHRVHFDGGQVNGALFLMTFRGSDAVLVSDR